MRGSATEYEPLALPGCEVTVIETTSDTPKVHPVAAMFPMMSDAELDELAADIQANGQVHPIVRGVTGQLIDGRNRLAACEIAGIEPRYETLPANADPVAYILSSNVTRRHLSTGQAAMAVAKAQLFATNNRQQDVADAVGVRQSRLAKAVVVLTHASDLADAVLAGAMSLDAAYEIAKARKSAASSAEARMEQLRLEAPDLADQVVEERLTLDDAIAVLKDRQKRDLQQRKTSTRLLMDVLGLLDTGAKTANQWADDLVPLIDDEFFAHGEVLSTERVERASAALAAVAAQLSER